MKLNKISSYAAVGSLLSLSMFIGCQEKSDTKPQNAFVLLQEVAPGKYKVLEESPSSTTTVVLQQLDGTKRVLSKEEIDEVLKQADKNINEGNSPLTNQSLLSSGGLGLGEAILASAAGAILGSWIGNKLFSSPGYQNFKKSAYVSPQAYSRSASSFSNSQTRQRTSSKGGFFSKSGATKSGFFSKFGG